MSKKQKTLFESWNKNSSTSQSTSKKNETKTLPSSNAPTYSSPSHSVFQPNAFARPETPLLDNGFDNESGKTWIYPTNYPIRDYQFSIVQECLFKNTLVVLPTGLGKTFIAAVVMYNIYRWYPKGKVVFMAPTRPLVAQQIDACYKVTGISPTDTTQMTGTNMPVERKRMWEKKRVFFLTPQVFVNDLVRNICSASEIKCVVVDEAHKALGNHAYCQVIRELQANTTHFRILALTATPGSDTQAVKMVLTNLLISHVEIRSEDSDDVKQYTHVRDIEKIVVPLGDRLSSIKSRFLDVINIYLKRLTQRRAMTSKNPTSLSKYQVLKLREEFSQNPPNSINKFDYGLVLADFSMCISLYHAYELLLLHGARPFHSFLKGILNGDKSIPHARAELLKNFDFEELFREVEENYVNESVLSNPNSKMGANGTRILPGHPKLEKLLEIVLQHFRTMDRDSVTGTRVMIFSQYRDSVDEIVEMLNHHQPMIKVMSFIGQSSKSATSVGYSQKHQLKVIEGFRAGGYNTLVSTCVGEEGLDIGEVDLIVCYDCPKSPIRLVQRMGRTGRLRKGRIVILVTEGKEEQMYNSCESKKRSIHRAISKGSAFTQLFQNSPSLIPNGRAKPVCVKKVITVEPPKPFFKLKGKVQESAFLNEVELMEFNNNFKIPRSERPLLPKANFISFKNDEHIQNEQPSTSGVSNENQQSLEPRLSLSKWMLWQTTPQRTHMVSHSSKSLILIETTEKINYPDAVHRPSAQPRAPDMPIKSNLNPLPADDINLHSTTNLNLPVIDLCSDDDLCDLGELDDIENETIAILNDDPIVHNLKPNMDLDVSESSNGFLLPKKSLTPFNHLPNVSKGNLFEKLFGFDLIIFPPNTNNCILKPPPLIENVVTIESITEALIEPETYTEPKNYTLRILNNKLRARLKRKSKEVGIQLSFSCANTRPDSFIKESITFNLFSMPLKENISALNETFPELSPTKILKFKSCEAENFSLTPKAIAFDIDFDNPQVFEKFSDEVDNLPPSSSNDQDKKCDDKKQEYDNDAFITEQFSDKVDDLPPCSLTLPDPVINEEQKEFGNFDALFKDKFSDEVDDSKPCSTSQVPAVNDVKQRQGCSNMDADNGLGNFSYEVGNLPSNSAINSDKSDNHYKQQQESCDMDTDSSLIIEQFFSSKDDDITDKLESSLPSPLMVKKVVFERDSLSSKGKKHRMSIHKDQRFKLHNNNISDVNRLSEHANTQPTQYGLTQLVSLIENTGHMNNSKEHSKLIENVKTAAGVLQSKSDENSSSDEEIEPTPPRNIIPVARKFCYRSNSANLDFDIKYSVTEEELERSPNKVTLDTKLSFDLSLTPTRAYHKSESKRLGHPLHSKLKNSFRQRANSVPDVVNASKPTKLPVGISFDLSGVHCSPERISENSAKAHSKTDVFTENLQNKASESLIIVTPDKLNSRISFDLSEVPFSPFEKDEVAAETHMGLQGSCNIVSSLDSESNILNRRISSGMSKFDTSISFDITDVQFSPIESKDDHQESSIKKPNANTVSLNPISFDLSDARFAHCDEDRQSSPTFAALSKQGKVTDCRKELHQSIKVRTAGNPIAPPTKVSFDLSEVEFSPFNKVEYNEVSKSKCESLKEKSPVAEVDPNTSFESPTLDKVFFDISFDFPDLKADSELKVAENTDFKVNNFGENVVPLNSIQASTSKTRNTTIESSSQQTDDFNVIISPKKTIFPQKPKTINVSKPCSSTFLPQNVKKPKSSEDLFPRMSNQNIHSIRNPDLKHVSDNEFSSKTLQHSPDSPEVFAMGKKRKRPNVLDDTTLDSLCLDNNGFDDFIQPATKTKKQDTICQNKKTKQKKKQKNRFLLTQADVSGSDSSGDDSEDEDAMDESFINDNTVVESPSNQRAMYLQSVKNIVGLPQKFKLKERPDCNEIYSQPIEEECSYMLDSFCVDDEDIVFTSSSEGIEENIRDAKPTIDKKKRKRIVAVSDTSSSEEEFVKKLSTPKKDVFIQKLTPDSNSFNIAGRSKALKTSSAISPIRHIGKDRKAIVSDIKRDLPMPSCSKVTSNLNNELFKQTKNNFQDAKKHLPPDIKRLPQPSFDNTKSNTKHELKTALTDPTEDFLNMDAYENFAFDVGWDDFDPEPQIKKAETHVVGNSSKSSNESVVPSIRIGDSNATKSSTSISQINEENLTMDFTIRKCSAQVVSCLNASSSSPSTSSDIKTILVDSRELASGKPVISCLRNKHGINPFVMQLVSADYILSNKVAVERILDCDFPSFGLPMKVIEKVRAMSDLYERPIVIIEKDVRKRSIGFNKLSTKYLQFSVCAHFHPTVKVLYSNSVEDTASIIYDIIEKERKKGLQIDVPVSLRPSSQKLYDFYLSIPHVSPICAFNFVYNFPIVSTLFSSSVEQLKKAGFISTRKANAVRNFLRSEMLLDSFS